MFTYNIYPQFWWTKLLKVFRIEYIKKNPKKQNMSMADITKMTKFVLKNNYF